VQLTILRRRATIIIAVSASGLSLGACGERAAGRGCTDQGRYFGEFGMTYRCPIAARSADELYALTPDRDEGDLAA
jgi:hypothetical protein